ncbi:MULTISPECIES: hypothetical protein [Sphingobacterium]|uniref:hypothetical protein n=1 Tax=Sphingobacterium TaxID=28453 RepID=UPI000B04D5A4|nr:hypothetical protein [Sphingobacterium sp. Ag1]
MNSKINIPKFGYTTNALGISKGQQHCQSDELLIDLSDYFSKKNQLTIYRQF